MVNHTSYIHTLETWTRSELEKKIIDSRLLSISRRAAVYAYSFKDRTLIAKSYMPKEFKDYRQVKNSPALYNEVYNNSGNEEYRKELNLLKLLEETRTVPTVHAIVPELDMILMSYEGEETFGDAFNKSKNERKVDEEEIGRKVAEEETGRKRNEDERVIKARVAKKFLDHLANFYFKSSKVNGEETRKLISYIKADRKPNRYLRIREVEEEKNKLFGYIYRMIYGLSKEFQNDNLHLYQEIPTTPLERKKQWTKTKTLIRRYLDSKKINLPLLVKDLTEDYMQLIYGTKKLNPDSKIKLLNSGRIRIIHGDYIPTNVIYIPLRYGAVLDLNECRFGAPTIDLASGLFNIYTQFSESRIPGLVEYFWNKEENGIKKSAYSDYNNFLIANLTSRLIQNLRISSSNSLYTAQEIERFVANHPEYKEISNLEKKKQLFQLERIDDLKKMIPYYCFGDGKTQVLGNINPKTRDVFNHFLCTIHNLINNTFIISSSELAELERYRGKSLSAITDK